MMKNIISLILIAAAVWIFWSYTNPIYTEAKKLREVRADYETKLAQANEFRQKYENLAAEYQNFSEADITRLSRLVPDKVDTVRLVVDVNDIAAKQGLLIKNIKISESVEETVTDSTPKVVTVGAVGSVGKDFNSVDLSFSVTGSYERFVAFIQDLERSLRILDVTEIKFTAPTDFAKGAGYDFDLGLRAYWLK